MANVAECPNCGAEYDVTGYKPGTKFQCADCKSYVTVLQPGKKKAQQQQVRQKTGQQQPRQKTGQQQHRQKTDQQQHKRKSGLRDSRQKQADTHAQRGKTGFDEVDEEYYEAASEPFLKKIMSGRNPVYLLGGAVILLIIIVIIIASSNSPKEKPKETKPVNPELKAHEKMLKKLCSKKEVKAVVDDFLQIIEEQNQKAFHDCFDFSAMKRRMWDDSQDKESMMKPASFLDTVRFRKQMKYFKAGEIQNYLDVWKMKKALDNYERKSAENSTQMYYESFESESNVGFMVYDMKPMQEDLKPFKWGILLKIDVVLFKWKIVNIGIPPNYKQWIEVTLTIKGEHGINEVWIYSLPPDEVEKVDKNLDYIPPDKFKKKKIR